MKRITIRDPGEPNNITTTVVGAGVRKRLIISVDLSRNLGLSRSKKSIIVGTTGGNKLVADLDGVKMNVNVYIPVEK